MRKGRLLGWSALLLATVALTACGSAGQAPSSPAVPQTIPAEDTPEPQPTSTPQVEATASEDQSDGELVTANELPLGDPALKASDPEAVNLATGEPQVVEFFAFW